MRLSNAVNKFRRPAASSSPTSPSSPAAATEADNRHGDAVVEQEQEEGPTKGATTLIVQDEEEAGGVTRVEAAQAVWGRYGKYLVWAGVGMMMITYELDNTTVYNYQNYAASSFHAVSKLATVSTACTILFAVAKPPIAKLADVLGRGETYCLTVSFYLLSYILQASARRFDVYAASLIFYTVGQTGTNIMNDIILSDVSSMRWRGFALSFSFFPFLIMPWVSAFIVESVIGGIGWRWGIGMLAIIMPVGASLIITTLLYYQRRAKRHHILLTRRISLRQFTSLIDLGGTLLLTAGAILLLLPITLAATTPARWSTPYIITLILLGALCLLLLLPLYESRRAHHPVLPPRYLHNPSILLSLLLNGLDQLGFAATHTYLYAWATVARAFGPRDATFLTYTNGVVAALVGMLSGLLIGRRRRYKTVAAVGAAVRLLGYGLMLRLRGARNPAAELFVVQAVQGVGTGLLSPVMLVAAQIQVPHAEMAQVTGLVLLFAFLGASVGSAVAGGIYTGTLKGNLRRYLREVGAGAGAGGEDVVDAVFDSITNGVPPVGTAERDAVDYAYSDTMRAMVYAAVAASALGLLLALLLPDVYLTDDHNLVAASTERGAVGVDEGRDVDADAAPPPAQGTKGGVVDGVREGEIRG